MDRRRPPERPRARRPVSRARHTTDPASLDASGIFLVNPITASALVRRDCRLNSARLAATFRLTLLLTFHASARADDARAGAQASLSSSSSFSRRRKSWCGAMSVSVLSVSSLRSLVSPARSPPPPTRHQTPDSQCPRLPTTSAACRPARWPAPPPQAVAPGGETADAFLDFLGADLRELAGPSMRTFPTEADLEAYIQVSENIILSVALSPLTDMSRLQRSI